MMEFPEDVTGSKIWRRLSERVEYVNAIHAIRTIADQIGRQVERLIPDFTDHSVRHMDALWRVADQVLTTAEAEQLSPGESLLLGASFYIHDLGMAFAATNQGIAEIRSTQEYAGTAERLQRVCRVPKERSDILAIRLASREIHARKALDLVTKIIPGVDRYLIEDSEFRSRWGHLIGQIAESHHWHLDRLHRVLGTRNATPTADGEVADLAYVACLLRVIDYAHINRERAPNLERAFRSEMSADSLVHWDAQANITGPLRQHDELVYSCTAPIDDVDAWWLFFDMASGLNNEIRLVREYLNARAISTHRFSLQGVRGVESPQTFTQYVQLAGDIAPIDIRVQPHSMERVVELLGGRQLYGPDLLAPLRELIQNARDAIGLRVAMDRVNGLESRLGRMTISADDHEGHLVLTVRDNGIGMKRGVVVRHLIGVGSDYWHSVEFFRDFGKAAENGFEPIGKFGIGFLSVFMLGDLVEVETESAGATRVQLRLRGLGRRGDLRETPGTGEVGTEIRIRLKPFATELTSRLAAIVRARAPMLNVPIDVRVRSGASLTSETIEPGWWKHVDDAELSSFIQNWGGIAFLGKPRQGDPDIDMRRFGRKVGNRFDLVGWPGLKPQLISEEARAFSSGGEPADGVLRCSQGIAIDVVGDPDLTGIMDIGRVELTASRESLNDEQIYARPRRARFATKKGNDLLAAALVPEVLAKMNDLERFGMVPARLTFLRHLASVYGKDILSQTSLRWIPVLEPPGNLIHRSYRELVDTLSKEARVVVGVGISPASTYSLAAGRVPSSELGRTMVLCFRHEEIDISYSAKERLKLEHGAYIEGTFDDVLKNLTGSSMKLELLPLLVDLISEAWRTSTDELRRQRWTLDIDGEIFRSALERGSTAPMGTRSS
jgi:hypothetical protein